MTTIEEIIKKAKAEYPYWCEVSRERGPDPRQIDGAGYGHFIRFPSTVDTNNWCFTSAEYRDKFSEKFNGRVLEP